MQADTDYAKGLELPGTPAVVVNGTFVGNFSYGNISQHIRNALTP